MQEDLRVWAVSDIVSNIFLHQICPVGSSNAVIIFAVFIGQRDASRAGNKLQHKVLYGHHYIQMISWSLASDKDGVHTSGALFWWRGLSVDQDTES